MRFENKKVLVTGGASGIGLAIARQFVAEGATVVITDIKPEALEAVQLEGPGQLLKQISDAGKISDIAALADWIETELGALDVLVNNAGFSIMNNPETVTEPDYDLQMNVMLKGPVFYLQHLAKLLRASSNGSVINISSASAIVTSQGYCPYALTKAAIAKLSEDSVIQVPGIRHNTIQPGFVDTPILDETYGEVAAAQLRKVATELVPCPRLGTVEDVAELALFLASDAASYINGTSIVVDGGLSRLNTAVSTISGHVVLAS
jgi:NAD(P)-dependent dehydrogenase (short-subunit alcohol dehydrogenase family)